MEVALMRRGNSNYNHVLAKLHAKYDSEINGVLDHLSYLKQVLKEVYKTDYDAVLDDILAETEMLEDLDEFKDEFFQFMKS